MKLTLAGQLLAERVRSAIDNIHDGLTQMRRLGRAEAGTLTVTFAQIPALLDGTLGLAFRRDVAHARHTNEKGEPEGPPFSISAMDRVS